MIKNSAILFLAILFSTYSYSQSGQIEGRIMDLKTGEPIPFANILIFKADDSEASGGMLGNDKGNFKISGLEFGSYKLVAGFIGYEPDTIRDIILTSQSPFKNTGNIGLDVSPLALEEVKITEMASTSLSRIDRKIYRASDFETASGGSAVDILNKLPSVGVSPDGIVTVRGTDDFIVYLNGKPTFLDASAMLSQIPADAIIKIEVITIPSAKYDAQGKGGIINITTRQKGQDGFSLLANSMGGGGPWNHFNDEISGFAQNDNRYALGLNMIYSKNKFSAYGGIYANRRNVNGARTGDARLLQTDGSYFHMVAGGERPEWYISQSVNAGIEYHLNDHTQISMSYYYGKRQDGRSAFYVYNTFFGAKDKSELSGVPVLENWIYNPNTDDRYGNFQTLNIEYSTSFNHNSELKLSALAENSGLSRELNNQDFDFDRPSNEIGSLREHFLQVDDTPLQAYRLSVDYILSLKNSHELSFGFQPSFFSISGAFSYDTLGIAGNVWNDYSGLENAIDLQRNIYAAYIEYAGKIGKLDIMHGLRMEYTDQLMKIENPDYFSIFERAADPEYDVNKLDLFPSLHLEYNFSERTSLSLASSRRISRPPIKNMAPFLYRRHFEVYVVGDPALEPENLSLIELSLNQKIGKQSLSLTGFYRGIDNAVFRVNTVFEEENVLIRSYTNSGNTRSLGAELNANIEAGNRVKFFIGGSLYHYRIQGDIFGFSEDNNSTNWTLKSNMNLIITKSLKLNVDLDVRSATVTAQGRNELFYMSNTALNYTPGKLKGWSFSAKVLDILGSNITGLNTRAFDSGGQQIFFQETEYLRFGPIAELGISYNLNMKGKQGNKADSEFGEKEF